MTKKTTICSVLAVVAVGCALGLGIYLTPAYQGEQNTSIEVWPTDKASDVKQRLQEKNVRTLGFNALCLANFRVRSGHYEVTPGQNLLSIFRMLRNGRQTPVRITLPSVWTTHDMANYLGAHLMLDSVELANDFADSVFCATYGFSPATLPAVFVPNTYEVYWNLTKEKLMERMVREYERFWSEERRTKAEQMGLTPIEVSTLASIVDAETSNNAEKPMVAGMYLNRLHIHMPLQADPTIKFALQDFGLRRIMHKHLEVESPYNTYKNAGLPPGPIRIATIAGIDAVLNHAEHDYLYMCAKEDFSGSHNFAKSYGEHQLNARRYAKALTERGIH
ncbi:MAG: endolytic transglycosylase MltG [Bacteroidaceae bacterium]|nr:endolytic transglycosylase MltG [Bacteroidaceae bacterium]